MSALSLLKYECKSYVDDPKYVYKSCYIDWLVIAEKVNVVNEGRLYVFDENQADFRAGSLNVVCIINKFTREKIKSIENSCFTKKVKYVVGEITHCDIYDPDLNVVRGSGLHYFLKLDPAFYFELDRKEKYTGKFIDFFSDGSIRCVRRYDDGIKLIAGNLEMTSRLKNIGYIAYRYNNDTSQILKEYYDDYGKLTHAIVTNL